jgi:subtilisin family serine protease
MKQPQRYRHPGRRLLAGLVLVLGLMVGHAGLASAQPPEVLEHLDDAAAEGQLAESVLTDVRGDGQADGFVIFADTPGEETRDALAERKSQTLERFGNAVEVLEDYQALRLAFVRVHSPEALSALLEDPQVIGFGANGKAEAALVESLPLIRQPAIAALGFRGAGTSVAVLDTGVDFTRAAFGSCTAPGSPAGCRVPFSWDFAPNDGVLDNNGFHGTNVAGIAAGVAPDTKILALDVFNGASAAHNDIVAAINWAVLNQATYNIRALNVSIETNAQFNSECNAANNPYVVALDAARRADILPVFAAGNQANVLNVRTQTFRFIEGVTYPACTPGAVRVGSVYDANVGQQAWVGCTDTTTAANQIVCSSQTGPLLTLLAPGCATTAAGITMCGTSMAAPHVAGAAAVLAGAGRSLAEIEAAIARGPTITDARNNVARPRLDLQSAFRTPPVLVAPPWVVEETTNSSGTTVTLPVSATDLQDPNPVVTCTPASGSHFPVGDTMVSCTATDNDGDIAGASFVVTVQYVSPIDICLRFPWKCPEDPK